jgi:hypothetical protein
VFEFVFLEFRDAGLPLLIVFFLVLLGFSYRLDYLGNYFGFVGFFRGGLGTFAGE